MGNVPGSVKQQATNSSFISSTITLFLNTGAASEVKKS